MLRTAHQTLEAALLPGEVIEAEFEVRGSGRVGVTGLLAPTSMRILVWDRFLDEKGPAYLTVPYAQVVSVTAQDAQRRPNERDPYSRLEVATATASYRFVLDEPGRALEAQRRIMEHVLYPSSLIATWRTVLRATDLVVTQMDPSHTPSTLEQLDETARRAALSEGDPAAYLADVITAALFGNTPRRPLAA